MEDPGGGVVAKLSVDGAEFWLSDESPEHGNFSPESLGGGSVRMILTVTDPDAVFARAIAAGASEVFPVGEEHGWRLRRVVDPFGHHWEQSRRPVLTNLPEKCDRKPETVVVTLVEADQEYDHVSLDLARDFKLADPSAYAPRSEIVLHGPPGAPLIP